MATPTTLPAAFVSGNVLTAAQLNDLRGAFRVLQVVSTTLTTPFTSSSTSFTDVTGLTATITPSSTSSKILVVASVTGSNGVGVAACMLRLARGGTAIFVGTSPGSRQPAVWFQAQSASATDTLGLSVLDEPASTSALTYSVQGINTSPGTFYINRTVTDTDNIGFPRSASSITVMEISA
jgi:hypothetical protein